MPDRSMLVLLSCFRGRQKCRQFVLYLRTSKVHKLKLAFSRNTLLSVPSENPRSETPHALGIPVQRTPPPPHPHPCLRNSSSNNPIPANSHALCVSLTPEDQKHRLHASRTISHSWLTNPDELFFNTWLITKIQLNFPPKGALYWLCVLTLSQHALCSL